MCQRRKTIRPTLCARGHDRPRRPQDVQESRQPGSGVDLRRQGVEPSAIRLGLLAGHYRADRDWGADVLEAANERLHRWRAATTLPAGPDAADVIARLRHYL